MKEVPILRAIILAWTLICVFIEVGLLVYIRLSLQNVMEEAKNSSETKILEITETHEYLYYKQDNPNINDLFLKTIFDDINIDPYFKFLPNYYPEYNSFANKQENDQFNKEIVDTDKVMQHPVQFLSNQDSDESGPNWWSFDDDIMHFKLNWPLFYKKIFK